SVTQFMNLTGNDLIKDQTSFSMYVDGFDWVGTLDTIRNESMYQLKIAESDTLMFVGYEVDPELDTIAVSSGWNWIGYLPQVSYPVDYALETLPATTGDLIKSQFAYAQYVEGIGWLGNLTYLDPQLGYLLSSLNEGELIYPFMDQPLAKAVDQADFTTQLLDGTPDWVVRAQDYEFSMNITGLLFTHDSVSTDAFDMIGAFVGDECRGVAQPVFIEALDQHMVFMTVYGSADENDPVIFRAYDADSDEELYIEESLVFVPNDIIGNVDEPFIWGARYLGIGDAGYIPDTYSLSQNYPNPFNPVTTMGFGLPEDGHVSIRIYNLLGQEIRTLIDQDMTAGYRFVEWNSLDDAGRPMTSGIYLVVMQSGSFREVKKMLMLK
ncbi:MAG: T9SS type A sorting domain-containing protein, partial [Candidatus Marinimicrobia bacterium]|nr:T9SS type A sorting domain-containing protein [Candidatus Neomarinimicrobiota bacterium]